MTVALHLLDARGRIGELAPWLRDTVAETVEMAERHLPLGPMDIVVRAGQRVVPEKGHGGYAPMPGLIEITIDPESAALRADADRSLARMIAHELHHGARWDGPGYGRTLGAALVSEGLAGQFVQERFGPPLEPWESLSPDVVAEHVPPARTDWDMKDYDHAAWFFGTGTRPSWLGYCLGLRMIRAHLDAHPGEDAATLVHTDHGAFRPALDRLA